MQILGPAARVAFLVALLTPASPAGAVRFTIAALPDTQNYSEAYPEIYEAQTQWIVDNAEAEGIVFVTHLGDIVDNADVLQQWTNARAAHAILDAAGMPYGTAMGNHDNNGNFAFPIDTSCSLKDPGGQPRFPNRDCDGTLYLDYFGPEQYEDQPWWGGSSPSGLSNYQTLELGSFRFLFLHLEVDPRLEERDWAQGVLEAHRDHIVLLTTHRYMYDYRIPVGAPQMPPLLGLVGGGRFNGLIHSLGGQDLYYETAIPADVLFADFIAANPNILMVHCGHVDAEFRQTSQNDDGLEVFEFLVDFQSFSPNGGDGWMRLVTFDIDDETGIGSIEGRTYSPTRDEFRQNGDGLLGSLEALNDGLDSFRSTLEDLFSPEEIEAIEDSLEYWSTPGEGQDEFFDLLYGAGTRDSEFVYTGVDFGAYVQVPEPRPSLLGVALFGSLGLLWRRSRGRRA